MYVRSVMPRNMEEIPQPTNVITVKTWLFLLSIGFVDTLCNTKHKAVMDHRLFVQSNICAPLRLYKNDSNDSLLLVIFCRQHWGALRWMFDSPGEQRSVWGDHRDSGSDWGRRSWSHSRCCSNPPGHLTRAHTHTGKMFINRLHTSRVIAIDCWECSNAAPCLPIQSQRKYNVATHHFPGNPKIHTGPVLQA